MLGRFGASPGGYGHRHDEGKAAMQALEFPASAWRPFSFQEQVG
jgi:hypothetical protein